MARVRVPWPAWLCLAALTVACSCSGLSLLPSSSGGAPQNFPLTPNPLSVQITLDTAHAVSDPGEAGVARERSLYGQFAGGLEATLALPGGLLTQDSDGNLTPAFGTPVKMTPVSAIGGLPFSQGYLAAFQLGPEGLLMSEPASLTVDLHTDYPPATLVGFASDDNGDNFHLVPIDVSSGGGLTIVTFSLSHFSTYGVAQATAAEVTAQQAHPPSSPGDQDEDLLAAPATQKETALLDEHDRTVKPDLTKVDQLNASCNLVAATALEFETWYGHVDKAGALQHFQNTIASDTSVLRSALKDCLKKACPLCLSGGKPTKASVNQMLTLSTMMQSVDKAADNMPDAVYWMDLANQCAAKAGLPLPQPPVAACDGGNCGPVATPSSCP